MVKRIVILFVLSVSFLQGECVNVRDSIDTKRLVNILTGPHWRSDDSIYVKSVEKVGDKLHVVFNEQATTVLLTERRIDAMTDYLKQVFNDTTLHVRYMANNLQLRNYIGRLYKLPKTTEKTLVTRREQGALSGRTFAIWNSHGKYYEQSLSRWEWQRARLFTTVEDLLSTSFVLPFLVPMIENSGGNVLLPRERDTQSAVVVVDNTSQGFTCNGAKLQSSVAGYKDIRPLRYTQNPFNSGIADIYSLSLGDTLCYSGVVEETGDYGVHVCYSAGKENSMNVEYTVSTPQWKETYIVNQRRAGSMWVFLGTHHFKEGESWQVKVSGQGLISADAVRLGGGMGFVERGGSVSGVPNYMEGARYYLQSDGFASSVYSLSEGTNDYTDDVNGRGEWVNALITTKNIPIDAAIALHTDAGIAQGDTTIGTLTIVSTSNTKPYSNGSSRRVSHALAHCIEQSIVDDIRSTWDTLWTERGIWDKRYSEARRADVPSVLIELLSHQNLNDIRYALHPQFRHDVCRAIYKGLLRFFEGDNAVVQPLPVRAFGLEQIADDSLKLSWSPTIDKLEPTATAMYYSVYVDGMPLLTTSDTCITLHQTADGRLREYYIRAVNKGGVSFISQVLGARLRKGSERAVVVDCNRRVGAPDIVKTDIYAGVLRNSDEGVAWGRELSLCGAQYDYDPQSPWLDDDAPGWGASYADMEQTIVLGNRGERASSRVDSLYLNENFSVVSVSKEYFEENAMPSDVRRVYISLGKEKTTWYGTSEPQHAIYSQGFMNAIDSIAERGMNITIAGNYVSTELLRDDLREWAKRRLGIKHMSSKASLTKGNTSVDSLVPAVKGACTIERYADTQASAAVRYKNIVTYGYEK